MSKPIIEIQGVGKRYRIGANKERYLCLRDEIVKKLSPAWRRARAEQGEFWALKDVSFSVQPGEAVGIIGRNGAGKSTLLKILSKITPPTEGRVVMRGRVASLLEVGTGFHPELTGRENIYLNGAILGMTRREIARKFDEIVAFAEIEKFLDTPVKRYSSGMYVRMAFAVAAHLDPEILVVDEVLAVGDAEFQKKCLGKMGEVAKGGRTVLFVSHNMGAIARLCGRAVWLDRGRLRMEGGSDAVVAAYESVWLRLCSEWKRTGPTGPEGTVTIERVAVAADDGSPASAIRGDQAVRVELEYTVTRPVDACQIGFRVCRADGVVVFTTCDADSYGVSARPKSPGRFTAVATIPAHLLQPGTYTLHVAAHYPSRTVYDVVDNPVAFSVTQVGALSSLDGRWGVVAPLIPWSTREELVKCG